MLRNSFLFTLFTTIFSWYKNIKTDMRRLTNDLLRIGRWNISTSYVWPGAVVWWPWHERPLDKILKDWEQLDHLWADTQASSKPPKKMPNFHKQQFLACLLDWSLKKLRSRPIKSMKCITWGTYDTKINNHSYLESQNRHGMGTACTFRVYIYMPIKDVILQILANLSAI